MAKAAFPKRIAGVKVPKRVRRTLRSGFGQNVTADALVTVVAALVAAAAQKDSLVRRAAADPHRLLDALAEAARAFARALETGPPRLAQDRSGP